MEDPRKTFIRSGYLLKVFTLTFSVFSILPLLLLLYFFSQYDSKGNIVIAKAQSEELIILMSAASLFLFFGLRAVLSKIILLGGSLKQALFKKIDQKVILELSKEKGEIGDVARAFNEVTENLEANIKELEATKKSLQEVIANVGKALTSMENFDALIKVILETTVEALGAQRGLVLALNENGQMRIKAFSGMKEPVYSEIVNVLGPSLDCVLKEKKSIFLPSLDKENHGKGLFPTPLVCAPLIYHDKVWGAFCISGKKQGGDFSEDEIKILTNLSFQIAMAFENVDLNRVVEKAYFETIAALAVAVEARDSYSRGHSERVGAYAVKIGSAMKLSDEDIKTLEDAARLHDIGKIGISDDVLRKPGKYTQAEYDAMKKHPLIGESIVKPLRNFRHLVGPIRHHHEFMDGSGYPDGLKNEEIPLIARILTVADIFDALITDRPYRKALSMDEAKNELRDMEKKGKLDTRIVATLFGLIEDQSL
jgi:hypothetical protein